MTIPEREGSLSISLAEAAVRKQIMEMSNEDDDTDYGKESIEEEYITTETPQNRHSSNDNLPLKQSSQKMTARNSALAASAASESEYNLACSSNSSPEHKIHTVVIAVNGSSTNN